MRNAAIIIQTYFRRFIAQKRLSQLKMIAQYENWAANVIQKYWRAHQTRKWFTNLRRSVVRFQANCRGQLFRSRMSQVIRETSKTRAEAAAAAAAAEQSAAAAQMSNNVSVSIRATPPKGNPSLRWPRSFLLITLPPTLSNRQNRLTASHPHIPIRAPPMPALSPRHPPRTFSQRPPPVRMS